MDRSKSCDWDGSNSVFSITRHRFGCLASLFLTNGHLPHHLLLEYNVTSNYVSTLPYFNSVNQTNQVLRKAKARFTNIFFLSSIILLRIIYDGVTLRRKYTSKEIIVCITGCEDVTIKINAPPTFHFQIPCSAVCLYCYSSQKAFLFLLVVFWIQLCWT